MDGHRPNVDKHVQQQVVELVHGEEKDVDVIGQTLREAIEGVEGMAGKRCRNFPPVMVLMDVSVDEAEMKTAMDPIDKAVCEEDESHGRYCYSPPTW